MDKLGEMAACKTVEYYQEIIGIELFLNTLNAEEKFWAMERKANSLCSELES